MVLVLRARRIVQSSRCMVVAIADGGLQCQDQRTEAAASPVIFPALRPTLPQRPPLTLTPPSLFFLFLPFLVSFHAFPNRNMRSAVTDFPSPIFESHYLRRLQPVHQRVALRLARWTQVIELPALKGVCEEIALFRVSAKRRD